MTPAVLCAFELFSSAADLTELKIYLIGPIVTDT